MALKAFRTLEASGKGAANWARRSLLASRCSSTQLPLLAVKAHPELLRRGRSGCPPSRRGLRCCRLGRCRRFRRRSIRILRARSGGTVLGPRGTEDKVLGMDRAGATSLGGAEGAPPVGSHSRATAAGGPGPGRRGAPACANLRTARARGGRRRPPPCLTARSRRQPAAADGRGRAGASARIPAPGAAPGASARIPADTSPVHRAAP